MNYCPNCKKKIKKNATFCDGCGTKIQTIQFCPKCGMQVDEGFVVCANCGAIIAKTSTKGGKKFPLKKLLMGSVAMIILIALLVGLLFSGGEKKITHSMATYIKNREIFMTNLKQPAEDPWDLTSCFYENDEVTDFELMFYSYHISEVVLFSEDGNRVFFLDKTVKDSGSTLYYRNTNKPENESKSVMIDSGVTHYTVNKAGTVVTYYKKNDKLLYQYDVICDAKEKIAEQVEGYAVSENGLKLGYLNEGNSIYLKQKGAESEKIADDVTCVEHISSDFKTFYYRCEDTLYKHVAGQDRKKLATNVSNVIRIDDSGKMYYSKFQEDAPSLMDYIEDDLQASDAKMQEPIKPTVPSGNGITYDEWVVLYEQYLEDYEAYVEAYNAYQEKLTRDALREELSADTDFVTSLSLYFFDGKKDYLITDTYIEYFDCADDAFVLSYKILNKDDYVPVLFSEIEDKDTARSLISDALEDATETRANIRQKALLEIRDVIFDVVINDAGTLMYYLTDFGSQGAIYQVHINEKQGVFGEPTLFDEAVPCNWYTFMGFEGNHKLMYFKDLDTYSGTLYANGKKIAEDVEYYSVQYIEDTDEWYYITNYDWETKSGTLKRYCDGKVNRIADDVYDEYYHIDPSGKVLYLRDYSVQTYKGVLCEWYKDETRTIDRDVTCILPVIDVYGDANYDWFISDWWWA